MQEVLLPIGICVLGLVGLFIYSVWDGFHRRHDYPGLTREQIRERIGYEESVRVQEQWAESHKD